MSHHNLDNQRCVNWSEFNDIFEDVLDEGTDGSKLPETVSLRDTLSSCSSMAAFSLL